MQVQAMVNNVCLFVAHDAAQARAHWLCNTPELKGASCWKTRSNSGRQASLCPFCKRENRAQLKLKSCQKSRVWPSACDLHTPTLFGRIKESGIGDSLLACFLSLLAGRVEDPERRGTERRSHGGETSATKLDQVPVHGLVFPHLWCDHLMGNLNLPFKEFLRVN